MQDAFYNTLRKHRLLSPGDRLLVGVSGGADSVALLHLLHSVSSRFPITLHAAHLDHCLRPESPQDADFVRSLCSRMGLPLTAERIDVSSVARERRLGIEEAAREVRREFLSRTAAAEGCGAIALGHHRGDQAETFLMRLLRGSGLSGLAAMRMRSGPFIRPLLDFTRSRILDYLAAHRLSHVHDASNEDTAFTRNRIRHELLPVLSTYNPGVEEHLCRLSRRIALEEDYWRAEEGRALNVLVRSDEDGLRLDRRGLLALHPALRARVLRRALRRVRGDGHGLSSCHIDAVDEMLSGSRPQAEVLLPRAWAGLRYELLWLRPAPPEPPRPFAVSIEAPGIYRLPGCELRVTLEEGSLGEGPWAAEFDASEVPFPLLVRSFRAGDRFRPSGMAGSKKLKSFFIDEKIERETRCQVPLVVAGEVLWVAGVRRCEGHRPVKGGGPVLRLVLSRSDCSTIHL